MSARAVCFDLDGTLLDTVYDLASAMNEVLARRGYPVHEETAYKTFVGDGAAMLVERSLPPPERQPSIIHACIADFRETYGRHWNRQSRLYDGIDAMLDTLVQRGIRLTILSNKPHDYTIKCATYYFARWPFEIVYGQRDGVPKKPDPTAALDIATTLGIAAGEFLFVGDSGVDMATGRAAGMRAIGVSWGFRPLAEINAENPHAVIDRPEELLAFCS